MTDNTDYKALFMSTLLDIKLDYLRSRAGARLADAERRLAALEAKLAEQVKPHTRIARERLDIGESMLFQLAKMRMELDRDQTTLNNVTGFAQWVAQGHDADDWKPGKNEETTK